MGRDEQEFEIISTLWGPNAAVRLSKMVAEEILRVSSLSQCAFPSVELTCTTWYL